MAKISVLMSVYNEKDEWLSMAIDSILNQTYSDFEFIIVNDNPTDERICRILSEYAERDGRVRIVTNEHNMGLVASLNNGLKYVKGEYVARMDADDISHPDRFEKQLGYIEKHGCDLISTYAGLIDENGRITTVGKDLQLSVHAVTESVRYGNIVSHTGWLAKAELFRELGGYRNMNAIEDYDLLLRACEKGKLVGMAEGVLIDIRRRGNSISTSNTLRQFIALCYLSERFGSVYKISADELESYVSARITPKRAENYVKAVEYIRIASKSGKVKGTAYVLKALMTSGYALKYLLRVLKIRKIKRGKA